MAHIGAITCFQHNEFKVLIDSDGNLKMWDMKDRTVVLGFCMLFSRWDWALCRIWSLTIIAIEGLIVEVMSAGEKEDPGHFPHRSDPIPDKFCQNRPEGRVQNRQNWGSFGRVAGSIWQTTWTYGVMGQRMVTDKHG